MQQLNHYTILVKKSYPQPFVAHPLEREYDSCIPINHKYMPRPTQEKKHLIDKRDELIWALSYQDYNGQDIGVIFNINRSSVKHIIDKKPKDYKPKWTKVQ